MAIEDAKKFLADLQSDESLAERADDAYVAALLSVAQEAGYDASERDLRGALDTAGRGDLTDEELEDVAGGFGGAAFTTVHGSTFNTAGHVFNTATVFQSFSKKGFLG